MDILLFASGGSINLIKAEIIAADGRKHSLGHKENELLRLLVNNAPDVVDKNTITEQVWQRPVISESAISVTIAKLRKLLKRISESDIEIITAKGIGYRLVVSPEALVPSDLDAPAPESSETDTSELSHELADVSYAKQDLLSADEKSALQEIQSPSDDALDWEKVDQKTRHWLPILAGILSVMSVIAWLSLNWVYDFTECRSLTDAELKENQVSVSIDRFCRSEISERDALKALAQVKKTAWLVLVDKNGGVRAYSEEGVMLK
ncbi:winged helix-turn-helix domain-containing protein [Litoribrevibacter albus]|uniref:OmpR/PhoB-type domain-containing protein n=1 Tax=Litoribrevibacter albus TaxID=1473156 RepID=A0AA37W3V2_9GAMM|nr:winged helix-turn-helix domain-containing protein [Litoribrevibacter albus]GLQ29532.1 hypothetical protein GCM10007876_00100 [Litoribrevibacter albus]